MEQYMKMMTGWWGFFIPTLQEPKKKPCRRTAKFKVTKTKVVESVFYSDAEDADKAKEEAWRAFNIYSDKVQTAPKKVDLTVEHNPHRMVDDDGYDTVIGLKYDSE